MNGIDKKAARRSLAPLPALVLTAAAAAFWQTPARSAEDAVVIPPPVLDEKSASGTEKAIFAGGCFWGVQGVFQHVKGVSMAVSGYAGGSAEHAVYEVVGTGRTGHAESVEITYDPSKVTYGQLLQVYFSVAHNPTQLNYQGPDQGTQYRSTIFAENDEQKKIAESYIAQLDKAKVFSKPIVTTLETGKTFYPAEDYHQDFLTLNPTYPYIVYNDLPKIENLKALFPALYSEKPVLVLASSKS
ncbi:MULTISPECIES: peptide-methionine (S)-S-oxide reductase MsrA [unclassified Mesorhizobium]|uniref:peptide-methionine (S)-S-oxide reductase MsrA n=2 Tax=Mesorhizobium TaxID=68287 RepID=UPI000BB0C212|nr:MULTISPECIES: peptide-methionine (S)-S-oxide reductase MsrA [unclassified Mesorhizobium]PBB31263.1 peptide-methionine (S)-S-oxide reductase [Mesorhizobium sp. WSM3882]RUU94332.1 peptide-methionine (S)-S-oxide reductase [Mesorhizobium sp. M1A.F.Ca.IN.020.03.2.1]RUV81014.1 peptide-methionine (S)-S-oxide reductase [Mesorhizobium sp. M1A.F.Ca.IN.020.32.1.1]RUW15330.1 peptide-methionine (S)-S-oxide reductase [Mesorhizobium sp. M1A.F.Ca.IN.022.05.2.1]RWF77500.1 MAG: peptide-methionine (S)-S-oxide